jgi:hypothetical protein
MKKNLSLNGIKYVLVIIYIYMLFNVLYTLVGIGLAGGGYDFLPEYYQNVNYNFEFIFLVPIIVGSTIYIYISKKIFKQK